MTWVLGVVFSVLGSCFSASGYTLQRRSANFNNAKPESHRVPDHKRLGNLIGVAFLGIEGILDWLALTFAAESLIASLGTVSVVLNNLLAPIFLGEKLGKKDIGVTLLAILGTTLCVAFSTHTSESLEWKDLEALSVRPAFIIYLLLIGLSSFYLYSFSKGVATLPSFIAARMDSETRTAYVALISRMSLPVAAAVCGGFFGLFSKALGLLIADTLEGNNQFVYLGSWLILLMSAVFLFLQIRILNMSLQKYEALFVVPVYEVTFALVGVLNGEFFYNDGSEFTWKQWVGFPLGVAVNLLAILLILKRPAPHSTPHIELLPSKEARDRRELLKEDDDDSDEDLKLEFTIQE